MAIEEFTDDMRQALVVSKNELVKYIRGKKIIVLGVLILLIWGLFTISPYALGFVSGIGPMYFSTSIQFMSMILVLIGTLFASGTIVSEFEERTALVIFTRPMKKWPVFIGKLVAALSLGMAAALVYYALTAVSVYILAGALPSNVFLSLGYSIVYLFAVTGVSMMISSLVKKSGTAAILTFFFFLLLTSTVYAMLALGGVEPWFIIDYLGGHITWAFDHGTNVVPATRVSSGGIALLVSGYDPLKAAGCGIAWGAATLAISYILMRRKEI